MAHPHIAHSERLLVVVGPSGAGKDSVLRTWRERLQGIDVHFAQRVITRASDAHEAHESIDEGGFGRLRDAGELATWWHAHGLLYGLRWQEFDALARGGWVVMNGSRAHLGVLRAQAPGLHAIEISASPEVLAARLAQRGREDGAGVQGRLQRDATAAVALSLLNDGALADTVDALHAWWRSAVPTAATR